MHLSPAVIQTRMAEWRNLKKLHLAQGKRITRLEAENKALKAENALLRAENIRLKSDIQACHRWYRDVSALKESSWTLGAGTRFLLANSYATTL